MKILIPLVLLLILALVALPVYATPTPPSTSAVLVKYGSDSNMYKPGQNVTAFVTIKNTGTATITNETFSIKVEKQFWFLWMGKTETFTVKQTILPGQTVTISRTKVIPTSLGNGFLKFDVNGQYRFTAKLYIDGQQVGKDMAEHIIISGEI